MTNLRDMLDSAARNLAAETEKLTGARTEAAALNSDKLRLTSELEDLKGKLEASQRMVGQLEGQLQTVKTELTMKSEQYVTTDSELQALRKSLTDELDTEKMRYCSLCVLLSICVLFAMCQPLALSVAFPRCAVLCQFHVSPISLHGVPCLFVTRMVALLATLLGCRLPSVVYSCRAQTMTHRHLYVAATGFVSFLCRCGRCSSLADRNTRFEEQNCELSSELDQLKALHAQLSADFQLATSNYNRVNQEMESWKSKYNQEVAALQVRTGNMSVERCCSAVVVCRSAVEHYFGAVECCCSVVTASHTALCLSL